MQVLMKVLLIGFSTLPLFAVLCWLLTLGCRLAIFGPCGPWTFENHQLVLGQSWFDIRSPWEP
jgi:hypothetical protein